MDMKLFRNVEGEIGRGRIVNEIFKECGRIHILLIQLEEKRL
jgi:hypothetical protein